MFDNRYTTDGVITKEMWETLAHPWLPRMTANSERPVCDNCKNVYDCGLSAHGYICGSWQEETERQLEMRL